MGELLSLVPEPEASARENQLRALLKQSSRLDLEWIKRNRLTAVPVESNCHFSLDQAELISSAFQNEGLKRCFAVRTEDLKDFPNCFAFPSSTEGLLAFSRECAHFNFAVTGHELSCVILGTVFDYYIVVGSQTYVENAVGSSIVEARKKFRNFADEDRLVMIAEYYDI
jgi:hypothetical protein